MLTQISQITQNYNYAECLASRESRETCSPPEGAKGNLTKFASLHSRIVLRKHSAKPTAASEAMQLLRDLRDSREKQSETFCEISWTSQAQAL